MNAKLGVVQRRTSFNHHVVADLKADTVAIKIAGGNPMHRNAGTILEKDAPGVVAVKVVVVLAVAIKGDIFNRDVGDKFAGDDGEERGDFGVANLPEVFAERAVKLKAIAGAGDEGAFDDVVAGPLVLVGAKANAITNFKPGGIGQRDLLIIPIAVGG